MRGITAIDFDRDMGNITHVEMEGGVDLNDLLKLVKDWNSGKWATTVVIGGDDVIPSREFPYYDENSVSADH